MAYSLVTAMSDAALPVDTMLPVLARTVDQGVVRDFTSGWLRGDLGKSWREAYAPMGGAGSCTFGCKVYARRLRGRVQFAVLHSLTYGHSHSPSRR